MPIFTGCCATALSPAAPKPASPGTKSDECQLASSLSSFDLSVVRDTNTSCLSRLQRVTRLERHNPASRSLQCARKQAAESGTCATIVFARAQASSNLLARRASTAPDRRRNSTSDPAWSSWTGLMHAHPPGTAPRPSAASSRTDGHARRVARRGLERQAGRDLRRQRRRHRRRPASTSGCTLSAKAPCRTCPSGSCVEALLTSDASSISGDDIARVREGRHPVARPSCDRIPADMVGMQMGIDDEIEALGRIAQRLQALAGSRPRA